MQPAWALGPPFHVKHRNAVRHCEPPKAALESLFLRSPRWGGLVVACCRLDLLDLGREPFAPEVCGAVGSVGPRPESGPQAPVRAVSNGSTLAWYRGGRPLLPTGSALELRRVWPPSSPPPAETQPGLPLPTAWVPSHLPERPVAGPGIAGIWSEPRAFPCACATSSGEGRNPVDELVGRATCPSGRGPCCPRRDSDSSPLNWRPRGFPRRTDRTRQLALPPNRSRRHSTPPFHGAAARAGTTLAAARRGPSLSVRGCLPSRQMGFDEDSTRFRFPRVSPGPPAARPSRSCLREGYPSIARPTPGNRRAGAARTIWLRRTSTGRRNWLPRGPRARPFGTQPAVVRSRSAPLGLYPVPLQTCTRPPCPLQPPGAWSLLSGALRRNHGARSNPKRRFAEEDRILSSMAGPCRPSTIEDPAKRQHSTEHLASASPRRGCDSRAFPRRCEPAQLSALPPSRTPGSNTP